MQNENAYTNTNIHIKLQYIVLCDPSILEYVDGIMESIFESGELSIKKEWEKIVNN